MFSDYIGIASELSFSRLYSKFAIPIVLRKYLCLLDCQFWLKTALVCFIFVGLSSTAILKWLLCMMM